MLEILISWLLAVVLGFLFTYLLTLSGRRGALGVSGWKVFVFGAGLMFASSLVSVALKYTFFSNMSVFGGLPVFSSTSKGILYLGGAIFFVIGLLRWITEILGRSNQAVADLGGDDRFRRLLDKVPNISVQAYKPDGTITYWNKASETIYGYSNEEAVGNNLLDLIIPKPGRGMVREIIAKAGRTGEMPPPEDIMLLHKDGHMVPVHSSHVAIVEDAFVELYCLDVDSERRNADMRLLQESEQRLRDTMNAIPAGIMIVDRNSSIILSANPAAANIFKVGLDELIGRDSGKYFHGVESQECSSQECPATTESGQFLTLDLSQVPLTLDGEERILLTFVDISNIRQAREEMRRARDLAVAANKVKDEFLANVSHELRTPLHCVLGTLQLVLTTNLDSEQRDYLEIARNSGKSLLGVINDILDVSKVAAGKLELIEREFRLGDVIDPIVNMFRLQTDEKGISLESVIDIDQEQAFLGDDVRIRQILFNLIGNAVKFTDKGGIRIEASLLSRVTEDEDDRFFFSIADTGIGIPDDQMQKIFEPFNQVDSSWTRKFQGSGLGLGIVGRLVGLMGGTLSMDSKEGEGTTVHFSIKVRKIENIAESENPMPESTTVSRRVLVIDDDRTGQVMTQRLLEKLGHMVTVVESGELALKKVERQNYDCIFVDIQLKGIDGMEFARRLRAFEGIDLHTPVIALTAHAMAGDRERFLDSGMDYYLSKPFDLADLKQVMERVSE